MSTPEFQPWLDKAEEDLAFARIGYKEQFYAHTCFLSQQCIEKVFKAFLIAKTNSYPRVHSLVDLLNLCSEADADFAQLRDDCEVIDEYYIPTRYPAGIPGSTATGMPGKQDAAEAVVAAERILAFVKQKL